jgi:hypothetical protein
MQMEHATKTIHTILREDFGLQDRTLVRSELLSARGAVRVSFEARCVGLTVEYDLELIEDFAARRDHVPLRHLPVACSAAGQWPSRLMVTCSNRRIPCRSKQTNG